MKPLLLCILLLSLSPTLSAAQSLENLGARIVTVGVDSAQRYIEGIRDTISYFVADNQRRLESLTLEQEVSRAQATESLKALNHWSFSKTSDRVIFYGMINSLLLTLLIMIVGLRELTKEP